MPTLPDEGEFLALAAASSQASQRTKAAGKRLATHLLKVKVLVNSAVRYVSKTGCIARTRQAVFACMIALLPCSFCTNT